MKKEKQITRILEYMKQHNGITAAEASDHLRVMRLAARISEMKEMGLIVADTWEYSYTPEGKVDSHWKRYKVVGKHA